jgi:hypothetical protein
MKASTITEMAESGAFYSRPAKSQHPNSKKFVAIRRVYVRVLVHESIAVFLLRATLWFNGSGDSDTPSIIEPGNCVTVKRNFLKNPTGVMPESSGGDYEEETSPFIPACRM